MYTKDYGDGTAKEDIAARLKDVHNLSASWDRIEGGEELGGMLGRKRGKTTSGFGNLLSRKKKKKRRGQSLWS